MTSDKMLCCVCRKKECKFVISYGGYPGHKFGFCSKVCIANKTINLFNIKKVVE
ncbi:MAG: hypothetical protein WC307_06325 [Candidatus Nanoarchaeia archaeon]